MNRADFELCENSQGYEAGHRAGGPQGLQALWPDSFALWDYRARVWKSSKFPSAFETVGRKSQ